MEYIYEDLKEKTPEQLASFIIVEGLMDAIHEALQYLSKDEMIMLLLGEPICKYQRVRDDGTVLMRDGTIYDARRDGWRKLGKAKDSELASEKFAREKREDAERRMLERKKDDERA